MSARELVLPAVVSEPGERTPKMLAEDLGLSVAAVQREVRRLRRAGLVEPAQCRIAPHHSGSLAPLGLAECSMARRIWRALVDGDGSELTQSRPKTRRHLAAVLEVAEDNGQFRRGLAELAQFGSLSLPADVWPTTAGCSEVGPLGPPNSNALAAK